MRAIAALLALTIGLSSACVRKQEKPQSQLTPAQALKPAPLAEHDLAGQKRATPRPTMGALEADAKTPKRAPPPPKKTGHTSRADGNE